MRIISGRYSGRVLKSKIPSSIRPTTDRLRERIFNILFNQLDWSNKPIVADIFAGSGAMGFEAISLGAKHCYFFENNKKAIDVIRKNAEDLRISQAEYTILKGDALKELLNLRNSHIIFDLCFLDPPYFKNLISKTIDNILASNLIHKKSIIVIEHSDLEKIIIPKELFAFDIRKDGSSIFQLLRLKD